VDLRPEGHVLGWTRPPGAASFFAVPSLISLFYNVLVSDGRSQTRVLKKLYRPWLRGRATTETDISFGSRSELSPLREDRAGRMQRGLPSLGYQGVAICQTWLPFWPISLPVASPAFLSFMNV
jgi:hypothetical protein